MSTEHSIDGMFFRFVFSDKQSDPTSAQFRFDSIDDNASGNCSPSKQRIEFFMFCLFAFSTESSQQCYMGGNSPADLVTDDEEETHSHHHHHQHRRTNVEHQRSPHSDETVNRSNSLSPSQLTIPNGIDDVSTTTPVVIKVEQENEFNSSSPSSPSIQTIPNKVTLNTNLPGSSSSSSSKRLTGTLNRLLNSVINRPNGHHYHQNGVSSSPSASSSATNILDSTTKEPKISLEMSTQSIESTKINISLHSLNSFFSSFCPTFR